MGVNAANVITGAPDQATTGAIASAPVGSTLPTSAVDTLDAAFTDGGYVSKDGVKLTPNRSTSDVRDWSGALIRQILTEFTGKVTYTHLEVSEFAAGEYAGDAQVTATAADATHGAQLAIALAAVDLDRKARVFKIKDGLVRVLVVLPDSQVTEQGEIKFAKEGAITFPLTLQAYPDSSGNAIYIYTDDGVTV